MGRTIEAAIIAELESREKGLEGELLAGNFVDKSLSTRDRVLHYIEEGRRIDAYLLHGTVVAKKTTADGKSALTLGVAGGAWQTVTTKARINAIAAFYGAPRVYQKKYQWSWSDGEQYEGARVFDV